MSSKEKLLASAQKNIEKGLLQKAIGDYQQVVELDPRDIRHRQKLADLLSRARMNGEAIVQYDLVAKNFSDNGFHLKAIAVYKQIQKLDPERVDTYQRLAELNVKQGLGGNALAEYRNLLALYEKKGLATEAAGVLQKLAELDPDNPTWRVRMVEGYARGGLKGNALEEAVKFVQQLQERAAHAPLQKVVERFLLLFPQDRVLQTAQARALQQRGETARAIQLLKELVKQDADDPAVLDALAAAYHAAGDFANERLTLKHMLKGTPDHPGLHERMLQCLYDGGETGRMLDLLERWGAGWVENGRGDMLDHWCAELRRSLPDEPRLVALTALVGSLPPAPVQSPPTTEPAPPPAAAAPVASPTVPTPPAGETPAPPPPAADEAASIVGEEMSLDFLEGMAGLVELEESAPVPAPAPEEPPPAAAGKPDLAPAAGALEPADDTATGELELELELDLGDGLAGLDADETAAASFDQSVESGAALELAADTLTEPEPGEPEPERFGTAPEGVPAPELGSLPELAVAEMELPALDVEPEPAGGGFELPALELTGTAPELVLPAEPEEIEELEEIEVLEELEEVVEAPDEAAAASATAAGEVEPAFVAVAAPPPAADEAALLAEALASVGIADAEAPPEDVAPAAGVDLSRALSASAVEVAPLDLGELVEELPGSAPDLRAELEEAEFFLQQGLFDAAEELCQRVLAADPVQAEAQARLAEIARRRAEAAAVPESQEEFFDLAAEVLDDGAFKATEDLPGLEDLDRFRFDGVFSEFKKGIESQIDVDDTESHYNLGIAYKEMGLIDDAIAEFDKAMKAPARMVDALTLKGICLAEKGAFDLAEGVFRDGIANPDVADAERVSLHYEMGLLYEVWGRPGDALKCFSTVAASDRIFRDVDEKLRTLREQVGATDDEADLAAAGKSGKDRVTYL